MIIKVIIRKEVCMSRGGVRPGAGRPKGQGKYNEPTKPIRISLKTNINTAVNAPRPLNI